MQFRDQAEGPSQYLNDFILNRFKAFELPSKAIVSLIFLILDEYPKLLRLSKEWKASIEEALDSYWTQHDVEQTFVRIYGT